MIQTNEQFLLYYLIINVSYFTGLIGLHIFGKGKFCLGVLLTILLSFLYSIRSGDIGSDASNYLLLIADNNTLAQEMSPFIVYIGKIVNALSGNGVLFFFIISLISNLTIFFAFYKIDKKNCLILMAVFSVSFLFLNLNINLLRQGMAISLGTLAIYYVVNNYFFRYFLAVLLAMMIHSSAVILLILPFVLLVQRKWTVYAWVFILLSMYILSISIVSALYYMQGLHWSISRLYWYLTWEDARQFNLKHVYYLYLGMIGIYLYFYERLTIQFKRYTLVFLSVLLLMVIFRVDDFIVDRFSFYFIPIAVVLYVNLYYILGIYRSNFYKLFYILLPFLWLAKSAYQFNLWWILGIVR